MAHRKADSDYFRERVIIAIIITWLVILYEASWNQSPLFSDFESESQELELAIE